jgi:hypothetical protein
MTGTLSWMTSAGDVHESFNSARRVAEDMFVSKLETGTILINPRGRVRIVRSRIAGDDGWNCTDGAPILDVEANDVSLWVPYTPDQLATALDVAAQVGALSTEPLMSGGIRTWDACSGRPCVLPKLAGVVRDCASSLTSA